MSIIAFIAILMIFIRLYSVISISFLSSERAKFGERITLSILILEIITIFFYTFFSSLKNLLPPILVYLHTSQFKYFILKNISIVGFLYFLLNLFLISTFQLNDFGKWINRALLIFIFLINIMLGFFTIML